jgi:MFS family permease
LALIEMFLQKSGITAKPAFTSVLLVVNSFVWYFYAAKILEISVRRVQPDLTANVLIWGVHFAGMTLSAIAGASLTNKVRRRTNLVLWMMLGVASSITPMFLNIADFQGVLIFSFLIGVSLGFGMPNCMGYFTTCTDVKNRGRLGGITMLASGAGLFFLGITPIESLIHQVFILAVWRGLGLAVLLWTKQAETINKEKKNPSFSSIFEHRSFILYLIPWIMFSLVNYLSRPVQYQVLGDSFNFLETIGNGIMAVFAVVGGFLSDSIGRKRIAITGFIMLGVCYAVLGISSEILITWYFYTLFNGIAWGFLFVIFVVVVWGDLSHGAPSDKYYAVGVLPFFISKFLQFAIGDSIVAVIPAYAIFSFVALFLFLAVLPLMYAPETLPEKTIKERELKKYIEKAKKAKEKYA